MSLTRLTCYVMQELKSLLMLNVEMLSVIILNVNMISVVMLSVIVLSVVSVFLNNVSLFCSLSVEECPSVKCSYAEHHHNEIL